MARPKRVATEERQTVTVTYTVAPAFIVTVDDPKLRGISGIGHTAKEAVTNLRSAIRRVYPHSQFDIIERTTDRQLMLAISWREPVYE